MNNDPATTQGKATHETSETDEALGDETLGSALGSAIGARVDDAVQTPPVSQITERAAARARARTVQRSVVAVAASVVLLAGGLVAYNALNSANDSTTVAVGPAVDTGTAAAETAAAESAASPPGEPLPPTGPNDDPDTAVLPDKTAASALNWTEDDPKELFGSDLDFVSGPSSAADGFIYVGAYDGSGPHMLVSNVLGDWTRVDIPVEPLSVDFSGDRWLLADEDTVGTSSPTRVFYSDDRGAAWTEVQFDPAPEGELFALLASGQNLVAVFVTSGQAQSDLLKELIASAGLMSDEEALESWWLQGNTVGFTTAPASQTYSFEIDDETRAALDAALELQILIYTSDGGTATLTGQYPYVLATLWDGRGSTNSDTEGFFIPVITPDDDHLLLSSVDGTTWTETSIEDYASGLPSGLLGELTAESGGRWHGDLYDGELRIKSLSQLNEPESTTATMAGMARLHHLYVGPAGMLAVAEPQGSSGDQTQRIGWSTDGNNWEWLTPAEAFGIDGDYVWVDAAVGTDFVLARVWVPGTSEPPRWFSAFVDYVS